MKLLLNRVLLYSHGISASLLFSMAVQADLGDLEDTDWMDKTDYRHYSEVKIKYANAISNLEWEKVFTGLADEFLMSDLDWIEYDNERLRFQNELDSLHLKYRFALLMAGAGRDSDLTDILENFSTGRFSESRTSVHDLVLFNGTSNEVVLDSLPDELISDLRYRTNTINRLLRKDLTYRARQKTLIGIRNAELRWINVMKNGYTQYPWELLLNGILHPNPDIEWPPRCQIIAVHPTLGVEVHAIAPKDLTAREVLALNLLGVIRYHGRLYQDYYGLSLVSTLRSDMGAGFGLTAHLSGSFEVIVTVHDEDRDNNWFNKNPYIGFSIDLYKWSKASRSVIEEQIARIKVAETLVNED